MALRWIDLLRALTPGSRPPFSVVLRIFFVSSFVSNFVPSVAADMYRAYALARHDVRLAESTASVLMDRVLGVLSMALVGAARCPSRRTWTDRADAAARPGARLRRVCGRRRRRVQRAWRPAAQRVSAAIPSAGSGT